MDMGGAVLMATFKFVGLDVLEKQLSQLERDAIPAAKRAVYHGSKVMADAIKASINGLEAVSDKTALAAYQKKEPAKLSEAQKQGLIAGFGIAAIEERNGVVNSKIGFDGYNSVVTRRWPKGQPNVLIARSCESGSSAMIKQPFVRPAISAARSATEKAIRDSIETDIKKITGGNK